VKTASLAERVAAVEAELDSVKKRQKTITTYDAAGGRLLLSASRVDPNSLLKLVSVPVPPDVLGLVQQWRTCEKEDALQVTDLAYMKSVLKLNLKYESTLQNLAFKVCQSLSVGLIGRHVLDTHSKNFYKHPTAKIDVSLSASDMVRLLCTFNYVLLTSLVMPFHYFSLQAFWPTLVSPMELKTTLNSQTAYKEAAGQV
jgi:hypothetical protein